MGQNMKLDARLFAIAEQVRRGVTVYDVGTDHAYLPVYLLQQRIVPHAVASDVAEGPLASAKETVLHAGLGNRMETILSDGLAEITLFPPCDVVIAGMGGDLMVQILSKKPAIKDKTVHLILQPMTKQENLRHYLATNGFFIDSELVAEAGKLYEILCCHYTGEPYALTPAELHVGRHGARREDALFYRMVEKKRDALLRAIQGKRIGGHECVCEEALAASLCAILKDQEENNL